MLPTAGGEEGMYMEEGISRDQCVIELLLISYRIHEDIITHGGHTQCRE